MLKWLICQFGNWTCKIGKTTQTHCVYFDDFVCVLVFVCVRMELTDWCRHLPPLQHCILGDAAVGVDVDALIFVANQNLCSSAVWQNDDGMGTDGTLDLWNKHTQFIENWKSKQFSVFQSLDTSLYIKHKGTYLIWIIYKLWHATASSQLSLLWYSDVTWQRISVDRTTVQS